VELSLLGLATLGFVVGAYGTVIGAGGGFVLVPILLLVFPEYKPETVSAISLGVVWANATSGSVAYARQHRIDYLTGLLFAISALPGVVAGALVVHLVPERLFSLLFALLLLGMTFFLLNRPVTPIQPPLSGRGLLVRTVVTPDGATYRYAYKIWQGMTLSMAVGFASSLFGIGGGVIHVPVMISVFHIPVQFAVATSHFILAIMSGGGTIVHLSNSTLTDRPLGQALALSAGAIPGAQVGAWISHRIKGTMAIRLLSVALVVLSARLIIKAVLNT
jgi:uncharacterized membrane protein YfcA